MKQLLMAIGLMIGIYSQAQEVKINEKNASFNSGSRNAIILTIPFVSADFMEKKIKEEIKSWGGKNSSSKGEYTTSQSQIKDMGEKMFDGFGKVIAETEGQVTVAFSFDLGGAFLNSSDHGAQYSAMSKRLKAFAYSAAKEAVADELKKEEKTLKNKEKEQESLEKDKSDLESDIENYKKKITEAQQKIEKNKQDQAAKLTEIKTQTTVIEAVSKKLSSIK